MNPSPQFTVKTPIFLLDNNIYQIYIVIAMKNTTFKDESGALPALREFRGLSGGASGRSRVPFTNPGIHPSINPLFPTPLPQSPPREITQFFKNFLTFLPGQKRPELAITNNNKKQQLFGTAEELTNFDKNNTLNNTPDLTIRRCNDSTKRLTQLGATLRNVAHSPISSHFLSRPCDFALSPFRPSTLVSRPSTKVLRTSAAIYLD